MEVELALSQIKSMTSSGGSGHSSSEKRGKDSTFVSMHQISTPKNFISSEYFLTFPQNVLSLQHILLLTIRKKQFILGIIRCKTNSLHTPVQ